MKVKEPVNFFDDLMAGSDPAEAMRQQKDYEAKAAKLHYLIHAVFEQNEKGKELIAIWKDALIMIPTADAGMDNIDIGIREGQKSFIRGIILTINRVERNE